VIRGWAVAQVGFIWDLEDDPEGNSWHICVEGNGITREEYEEVVSAAYEEAVPRRTSGRPTAFGWTATGKYLAAVFEVVEADVPSVYPITASEAPPPGRKARRKKR
jgi:hypothetical protein